MLKTKIAQRRALGYARVSTGKQVGEHHSSLETQQARVADYIALAGDVHIETFVDVLSGRRDDRPEYNRMVDLALAGGADVIIVQFLDRLGRNPREILRRIWQLQDHGVAVEVTDEDIKEELLLLIRAGIAGAESKKTSERVKANMARIVGNGTHSGRVPFGFKAAHKIEGGKVVVDHWEIDPQQAEIVQEMARLAVEENLGFLGIANRLNELAHKTRAGGHWVSSSVQVILRNPALNGTMVYGRRARRGNVEDDSPLVTLRDVFPKLLTDSEWTALQERLDIRREHSRGSTHKSEYLLSGMLRCGHCRGPMNGKVGAAHKGKRYRNYYCSKARASRASCGYYNGHSAPKLEAAILEHIGQYSNPKKVRELLAADGRRELKQRDAELQRVKRRLGELEADFDKNLELHKRDVLNEEEFRRANELRREERARLESRHEELVGWLAVQSEWQETVGALPVRVRSFLKDIQDLDVRQAKALLQTVLKAAHVYRDGRIKLEFRT